MENELHDLYFAIALKIRRTLQKTNKLSSILEEKGGVSLPWLEDPSFDGIFIVWHPFWEQYSISVHERKQLSDFEKLAYLKLAFKGGSATRLSRAYLVQESTTLRPLIVFKNSTIDLDSSTKPMCEPS